MSIVVCCGGSRLDQNPGCCERQHEGQPSELISHDTPSRMCAGRGALPGPSLTPAGEVSRPSAAHPAFQNKNLLAVLNGVEIELSSSHAKVRRAGYYNH